MFVVHHQTVFYSCEMAMAMVRNGGRKEVSMQREGNGNAKPTMQKKHWLE